MGVDHINYFQPITEPNSTQSSRNICCQNLGQVENFISWRLQGPLMLLLIFVLWLWSQQEGGVEVTKEMVKIIKSKGISAVGLAGFCWGCINCLIPTLPFCLC